MNGGNSQLFSPTLSLHSYRSGAARRKCCFLLEDGVDMGLCQASGLHSEQACVGHPEGGRRQCPDRP